MLVLKDVAITKSHKQHHKQHLIDLPLITRPMSVWDYAVEPDNEAAFVYTLYVEGHESLHYYAKGALYSALTFLDKTDLRDRGIPIYFALQDIDYNDLRPYFSAAGVKDEHIISFTPTTYGVLKIMDAFFLPELQRYKRLFMVDPDVFARPIKKYSLADKILWNTKKYPIAALDLHVHYDNWSLGIERYHKLKESESAAEFPQISDTPSHKLLEKMADTTVIRTYMQAGFVGFSDTFLSQIAEPYRKIAAFTLKTYPENDLLGSYLLSEEDFLCICALEFQTNIYDFNQKVERTFHFVRQNDPDRNTTVINHIYSTIDDRGTKHTGFEYHHWKDQWQIEIEKTLQRLR